MSMATLRALVDLLAPRRCPGCDEPVGAEARLCLGCAPLLEPVGPPHAPPAADASAYEHGGPLADAVHRLKYDGRSDLSAALGALLAESAAPYGGRVDEVAPVPLHRHRLRARGYDQAALLARPVARALGVPLAIGRLARVRPTRPQVGLDRAARQHNVTGAFRVCGAPPARVLLVDDVRTTGATLAAAAGALREAGARDVRTLTLARAVPH